MKRLLSSLLKPWVLSAIGLLLLALLIWFEGPLLAFDGKEPLASAGARWTLICLVLLLAAACYGWRVWRARRSEGRLAAGVAAADAAPVPGAAESAAEVAVLGERMRAAMAVLRKANPGWKMSGQYLYQLPWYMFVGAPGSGKTTALTHSGLQFPLADALGAAPSAASAAPAIATGGSPTRRCCSTPLAATLRRTATPKSTRRPGPASSAC